VKFVTIRIPVSVESEEIEASKETLSIKMFVSSGCTHAEAVFRLADLLQDKLNTVDLGDDE
jgi:hypothetical protein